MSDSTIVDSRILQDTEIIRYANGLDLILREDHRAAVATCNVWVRVGSNREYDGVRGWSHGIEHMLFKGTERRAEGDFAVEVADIGGTTNAGTGYETTNYHITVPARNLDRALDILHDALFNSAFDPESLDAEREVLVHENHMYDDLPSGFGASWRWGMESAFDSSPYRYPIGGVDTALLDTPRKDILEFYRTAYGPENMTVVVVGDVDAEAVKTLVGKSFAAEPAGASEKLPCPPPEPRHDAPRLRIETGDLNQVYAKIIFPSLAETDPDRPVSSIIQMLLSDGRSSRLYRRIQEDLQLVNAITILGETGPREGLMIIDFETDADRLQAATDAICGVLSDLVAAPAGDAELDRAKIRAERSHVLGLETVQGQAANLGWHHAMGDLDGAFVHAQRLHAVEAGDVQRVAARIFDRNNASLMYYLPQDDPAGAPSEDEALAALRRLPVYRDAENDPRPSAPKVTVSTTPTVARSVDPHDSPFEETVLENGLRIYYRRDETLPVFCMGVHAAGGVCHQGPHPGLAYLTQQVQIKGTPALDAARLHDFVESRGASLSPFAARDHTGIYLTGLTRESDPIFDVLGDLCCAPSLSTEELERERKFALDDLRALADEPFQLAGRTLREMVYPDHPYGSPMIGTESSLPGIGRDRMVDFHERVWTSRNVHIVASGNLDRSAFLDRIEHAFRALPEAESPPLPNLDVAAGADGPARRRLERDVSQSIVLLAWRIPPDPNMDRAGMALLQKLMNGQSGRLFENLRNKHSLCYATGIQVIRGFGPGMIVGYVMTSPDSEAQAREALAGELARVCLEPASDAEFERARQSLIGNMLISLQSNSARVSRCATDVLYGRVPNNLEFYLDEIDRMTPESVREIAERYLGRADRFEVVVGPGAS